MLSTLDLGSDRSLAARHDSRRRAARRAGLDATTFNRSSASLRTAAMGSTEASQVLKATGGP
jgi:hypothetical protein